MKELTMVHCKKCGNRFPLKNLLDKAYDKKPEVCDKCKGNNFEYYIIEVDEKSYKSKNNKSTYSKHNSKKNKKNKHKLNHDYNEEFLYQKNHSYENDINDDDDFIRFGYSFEDENEVYNTDSFNDYNFNDWNNNGIPDDYEY